MQLVLLAAAAAFALCRCWLASCRRRQRYLLAASYEGEWRQNTFATEEEQRALVFKTGQAARV
jgi:hypothetical protein